MHGCVHVFTCSPAAHLAETMEEEAVVPLPTWSREWVRLQLAYAGTPSTWARTCV